MAPWSRIFAGVLWPVIGAVAACAHVDAETPNVPRTARALPERDASDARDQACPRRALSLPFPSGTAYATLQGAGDAFTHHGADAQAIDFDLPEGALVVAAAAGVVVEVVDTFSGGGTAPELKERANVVVVDLGEGCFAVYQHLASSSVLVREGERVERGEALARSGNTGWSSRPHLHFEITDVLNRSLELGFVELGGRAPKTGELCRSENALPARGGSTIPREIFAGNGIVLDDDLPARHFTAGAASLRIRGHVTTPVTHVVAVLFERGGDAVVSKVVARVDTHGAFVLVLPVAGSAGRWNFAVAVVDEHGRFHSDVSVPVVVAPTRADASGPSAAR